MSKRIQYFRFYFVQLLYIANKNANRLGLQNFMEDTMVNRKKYEENFDWDMFRVLDRDPLYFPPVNDLKAAALWKELLSHKDLEGYFSNEDIACINKVNGTMKAVHNAAWDESDYEGPFGGCLSHKEMKFNSRTFNSATETIVEYDEDYGSEDDGSEDDRSGDDRSGDDRSGDDRSEDDRSEDDRSEDDRSDKGEEDKDEEDEGQEDEGDEDSDDETHWKMVMYLQYLYNFITLMESPKVKEVCIKMDIAYAAKLRSDGQGGEGSLKRELDTIHEHLKKQTAYMWRLLSNSPKQPFQNDDILSALWTKLYAMNTERYLELCYRNALDMRKEDILPLMDGLKLENFLYR